jgi:hypothetical protein
MFFNFFVLKRNFDFLFKNMFYKNMVFKIWYWLISLKVSPRTNDTRDFFPWNVNGHPPGGCSSFLGKQFIVTVFTNVMTVVLLCPEEGGKKFLWNVGLHLPDCTMSYSRRPSPRYRHGNLRFNTWLLFHCTPTWKCLFINHM